MDIVLVAFLILLNGIFAMSEIALISARRARLQNLAETGDAGAQTALALNEEPSAFLSTIQVGITVVGILNGAVGEAALAVPVANWLTGIPALAPYAHSIALILTVAVLTYFSVVVGELVPKQLALVAPEGIAARVARPMLALARLAHPLVTLLSGSSRLILGLLAPHRRAEPPVTDDEIKVLMEQGAEAGVFHESEQEIVSNVLRLDEQRIATIMTPRPDMALLDLDEGEEAARHAIVHSQYSRLVVCRDGLDNVIGILPIGDLLKRTVAGRPVGLDDIEAVVQPPLYVPETVSTTQLLENFRRSRLQFALIVDEYGEIQGLVTATDVLSAIVGELAVPEAPEERDMVRRDDGSWLVDGDVAIERVKAELEIADSLPGEDEMGFHTLGGFIMHALGRIPCPADHFETAGWRFEVMDMDRKRVDKVLIARRP